MKTILRHYQTDLKKEIYDAWNAGHRNVLAVMPTGAGKTRTFSSVAIDLTVAATTKYPTAIMVHRKELISQICLTLAEEEIPHNIIAQRKTVRQIIAAQRQLLRRHFYNDKAPVTVLSVDTLNSRIAKHQSWAKLIKLWIVDEAAHLLAENKWGKAVSFFPNAFGLGVTATPCRLDKRGLGRHADGVFDVMVEGPTVRWLIDQGYLCNYKIAIPKSDYQHFLKKASSDSDYSKESMSYASEQSQIIGDVVDNYLKFTPGKQTILFTTDVKTGHKMEKKFKDAGVRAKFLSAETPDKERFDAIVAYRNKETDVLLNVDLFDEGFDVPGIEGCSMARPTMSLSKYLQMVGRALRPVYAPGYDLSTKEGRLAAIAASSKPWAIIVDHVGNVMQHGLPDKVRRWTLDRIVKRQDKTNLLRICSNAMCNTPYDRVLTACPWCGTEAVTRGGGGGFRPGPEQVDGDLELIDPDILRQLEAASVLEDPAVVGQRVQKAVGANIANKAVKDQRVRIETQGKLRDAIAQWAGWLRSMGYTDRQIHKRFYLQFDMTITQAMSEPTQQMLGTMSELQQEIR